MMPVVTEPPDLDRLTERERGALTVRLRQARRAAGIAQSEAAEAVAVGGSTLSRLERGLGRPRRWLLQALADLYGVDYEWLAHGSDSPEAAGEPKKSSVPEPEPLAADLSTREDLLSLLESLSIAGVADEDPMIAAARSATRSAAANLKLEIERQGPIHRALRAVIGPSKSLQRAFDNFAATYDALAALGGAPPRSPD